MLQSSRMLLSIISLSVKQTEAIAAALAFYFRPGDVVALIGNLGSGKTVFVKGLALGLGCRKKDVLSPTFVLMRQYKGKYLLHHFDLYRLKNVHQLEEIGYEEYFYGDGITVIEWADRIEPALPKEYLRIEFRIKDANKRRIEFIPQGKRYADYLRQFQGKKDTLS